MAREKIPTPILYCCSWRIGGLSIYAASTDKGAFRISLSLKDEIEGCAYFKKQALSDHFEENRAKNRSLISAVEAALQNRSIPDGIPMDIHGTPFQWKAWKAITSIPFGMTKTYGEVAAMVGKSAGARAVGQAMSRNPLPLIFP
ncbi:MAG: methylated-DNA--[protein]-cysteine S-methyltransferase [Deltaproteobacteria bacterium]|nr:methylated-DNA--[protein]-cysteine S-methyltransferase [Deltaproteobacteria bacterium]